MAVQSLRPTHC